MKCPICQTRNPRRQCPGVQADICSVCCGSEREVSIDCPLDCSYLREARAHQKLAVWDPATMPNADIDITERFIQEHRDVALYIGLSLHLAVAETAGAVVDRDVREALHSLTSSYRSLVSGILFESPLVNPFAHGIYKAVRAFIAETRVKMRDSEILGALVLYQRMALSYDNGRPKGRAFIYFLGTDFKAMAGHHAAEREAPRLIEL